LRDTYRGVCRLSYFPYDVEPYFVPTAMAERRKQQGKRNRVVFLRPIAATRRHYPFAAIVASHYAFPQQVGDLFHRAV